jgi:hypothetical protein
MDSVQSSGVESMQYKQPKVVDYGPLRELTKAGGLPNSDVPAGTPGTAFSAH